MPSHIMIPLQAIRKLSTSAVRGKLVMPPIRVYGIAGRYATALYSAASKSKSLEVVEKDLKVIRDQMQKDQKFRDFCLSPTVRKVVKAAHIGPALDKLKVNALTKNTMIALAENGRLQHLGSVAEKFQEIMSAYRGEVVCKVRTAKPLDTSMEKDLRDVLSQFLKPGGQLQLSLETDPSLIGGMVVTIGDRYVDMSIAQKIRTCRQALEQPV